MNWLTDGQTNISLTIKSFSFYDILPLYIILPMEQQAIHPLAGLWSFGVQTAPIAASTSTAYRVSDKRADELPALTAEKVLTISQECFVFSECIICYSCEWIGL